MNAQANTVAAGYATKLATAGYSSEAQATFVSAVEKAWDMDAAREAEHLSASAVISALAKREPELMATLVAIRNAKN